MNPFVELARKISLARHRSKVPHAICPLSKCKEAVCAVAVVGTATSGAVARRIVTAATRRTATTTLACGWPFEFATKLSLLAVIHFASHCRVLCSKLPRDWHRIVIIMNKI